MKTDITILVVDDEVPMRDLLNSILTRDGYRVLLADCGAAALDILECESVDLVISDLKMPGMNGFELLKRIKADHPEVGVIMVTAFGDTYTVKDAILLGADDFVTKPFKGFEISLVVEKAYWRIMADSGQKANSTS